LYNQKEIVAVPALQDGDYKKWSPRDRRDTATFIVIYYYSTTVYVFVFPYTIYLEVFPSGTLSFCFSDSRHGLHIRERIDLLRDHYAINSDWIFYAFV
jgi:hypothetical protein